jgi:hypothetical protein
MGSVIRVSFDTIGIEMAFQSLVSETPFTLSFGLYGWLKSMVINGLVWMGERLYEATN